MTKKELEKQLVAERYFKEYFEGLFESSQKVFEHIWFILILTSVFLWGAVLLFGYPVLYGIALGFSLSSLVPVVYMMSIFIPKYKRHLISLEFKLKKLEDK